MLNKINVQHKKKLNFSKWYLELIENMERENLQEYGHLPEIIETIGELSYLHKMLINVLQDREYISLWEKAYENIVDLQKKSNDSVRNPIELCFNGIYGTLMLRIQKRSINQETLDAVETFSKLLTCLSKRYNDVRSGKSPFPCIYAKLNTHILTDKKPADFL